MISSTNPAYSLTVHNAASPGYTLKVMTVIAVVLLPVVLAYQGWTYYVFRRRVSARQFASTIIPPAPTAPEPAATPGVAATAASPALTGSRRSRHRLWRGNHD